MSPLAVAFVLVCGIGALNSLLLAGHLWVHRRGDRVLNRLLAALVIVFAIRVAKAVVVFFVSRLHPAFDLVWLGVLGATGGSALFYLAHLAGHGPRSGTLVTRGAAVGAGAGVIVYLVLPAGVGWKLFAACLSVYAAHLALAAPFVFGEGRSPRGAPRAWAKGVFAFLAATWALYVGMIAWRFRGPINEDAFFNLEAILFSAAVYGVIFAELRLGLVARIHPSGGVPPVPADDPMLRRVREAVETNRLFLDPALSLPSLASRVNLSPQHVSRLINAGMGVGFNDYVNRLRVEEAQRVLADPEGGNRKIGTLAFDCGFNSPSVFYAAFKKFTGRTPSEYQKDLAAHS
ncbi:MAG TPA: helix-turn-helix domain-containing protein [Vicinamibacterales bacterium]|nr:helix-turn-helix domain-containing protein [Vicinamibacterales bacterium]